MTPVSAEVLRISVPSSEPSGPGLCPVACGGDAQAALAGVGDHGRDLALVGREGDRLGLLVDQEVERAAGGVPVAVAGPDDVPEVLVVAVAAVVSIVGTPFIGAGQPPRCRASMQQKL